MLDNFFKVKPLEDWLKEESGLIYQNNDAFVCLNVTPSSFGHSLVIPKRVVYKATDMTPQELYNFMLAKETGLEQLDFLVHNNPEHLIKLYQAWANDETLNKRMPVKQRVEIILKDLQSGEFKGGATNFENVGEVAGQMIKHYHVQIVPRFRDDLKGGGEALFKYLHD